MLLQCRTLMKNWGAISQVNSEIGEVSGKVPEFVMGTYTGDDTAGRKIELGFTPRALLVVNSRGSTFEYQSGVSRYTGAFVLKDFPALHEWSGARFTIVKIVENGFIVNREVEHGPYVLTNSANDTYKYIALK